MQAPRLQSISLPRETYPFTLHHSLSHLTTLCVDLSMSPLRAQSLVPEEASQPATYPPTRVLRVVHPSLVDAITVRPSSPRASAAVSVSDVLTAVHAVLHRPLRTSDIPAHRRADVLSYVQAKAKTHVHGGKGRDGLKVVDLLEGASLFRGLQMDVVQSNRMLGVIDEMQALTWILLTYEPQSPAFATTVASLPPVSSGHASPAQGYSYVQSSSSSYGYDHSQSSQQQPSVYLATSRAGHY